ncbi:MAG: DJ-1/PfpI family protein [Planctomycetota bacterium]
MNSLLIAFARCPRLAVVAALPLAPGAAAQPGTVENDYTLKVAIVVYEGVEILDFTGPGEVFAAAARYARSEGRPGFDVFTVSVDGEPVRSQGFIDVIPNFSIEDSPRFDILVLPGGPANRIAQDEAFMGWVRSGVEDATLLTVCTGAVIPARLGMLDGETATTWYGALDRLAEETPDARFVHGKRYVDSGEIITTAGVSAGIDGSLHLVARIYGKAVADRTAQYMEYRWTPEPYLMRTYALLNPRVSEAGREEQLALMVFDSRDWEREIVALERVLESAERDGRADLLRRLGFALMSTERYQRSIEVHRELLEEPGLRGTALYNIACAHAQLGHSEEALSSLEDAVRAGFANYAILREDPDLDPIRGSERFRRLLEVR